MSGHKIPKKLTLADLIAQLLGCPIHTLRDRLNHPANRERVIREFAGKQVTTTYMDRSRQPKSFRFGGLSRHGAALQPAYGKFGRAFNPSVSQHFYTHHRIKLTHPYLHCAIERFTVKDNKEHYRFYPLELLRLDEEEEGVEVHLCDSKTDSCPTLDEKMSQLDVSDHRKGNVWVWSGDEKVDAEESDLNRSEQSLSPVVILNVEDEAAADRTLGNVDDEDTDYDHQDVHERALCTQCAPTSTVESDASTSSGWLTREWINNHKNIFLNRKNEGW
jgi:hypothetical protein